MKRHIIGTKIGTNTFVPILYLISVWDETCSKICAYFVPYFGVKKILTCKMGMYVRPVLKKKWEGGLEVIKLFSSPV